MTYRIYDYSNTHVFHRKALLNAIEKVNTEFKMDEDVLVIVSTRNMLKALPLVMLTRQKTVVNIVGFGRLFSSFGVIGRIIFNTVVRLYCRRSTKAFIVENDADRAYLECLTAAPVFKSHGSGLDVEGFIRDPKPKGKRLRLGYLSRFHRSKGSDQIIDVAKALPDDRELIIAGWDISGNKFAKAFQAIAENKSNVKFIGKLNSRREVSIFFNDIDIFLSPSVREGGNISLQEGIWHHVPFITTDSPGCEVLANIFNGYMVKIDNFADFVLHHVGLEGKEVCVKDWDALIQPFLTKSVEDELIEIFTKITKNR